MGANVKFKFVYWGTSHNLRVVIVKNKVQPSRTDPLKLREKVTIPVSSHMVINKRCTMLIIKKSVNHHSQKKKVLSQTHSNGIECLTN